MHTKLITVISGGQTGVDRAALDVALELGIACGGYCPKGRIAEDGVIEKKYPLKELDSSNYIDRTLQNVLHSDGTLIIYNDVLEGGTLLTLEFCRKHNKPYLKIDVAQYSPQQAAPKIEDFMRNNNIKVMNVAGPRASKQSSIYDQSKDILKASFAFNC